MLSLTSIMSTTGDPDVGQPTPEVAGRAARAGPPATARRYIAHVVDGSRAIGSPEHFDEEPGGRASPAAATTAASTRPGVGHQLVAIVASPQPHRDGLRQLDLPALVIHGDDDPLVDAVTAASARPR